MMEKGPGEREIQVNLFSTLIWFLFIEKRKAP